MPSSSDEITHTFISYAHVDNQPLPGSETGWVSYLHRALKPHLERALGLRCRIWFDESALRGNHAVTPEIVREIERAQTFVAVLTPGYLASKWCRRELELFTERNEEALSGRIFLI